MLNHKPIIIAGFHRSGTSMLAQELSRAGVALGEHLMPANFANQDGYYEDMDIVHLHDQILRYHQTDWQYAQASELEVPAFLMREMSRMTEVRNQQNKVWGFKDPRVVFFLQSWHQLLDQPYTIIVYRHYNETTRSLLQRASCELLISANRPALRFWQEPELAYQMWLQSYRRLLDYAENNPDNTLVVSQQALVQGFDLISYLNERWGLELDNTFETGIKPERLSNPASAVPRPSADLEHELDALWQQLQQHSVAPAKEQVRSARQEPDKAGPGLLLAGLEAFPAAQDVCPLSFTLAALNDPEIDVTQALTTIRANLKFFLLLGKQQDLLEWLYQQLELRPEQLEYWQLCADIHQACGEYAEAERCLLLQAACAPRRLPWQLARLGEYYCSQFNFDQAAYFLDKAIAGNAHNPAFYLSKARLKQQQYAYDEALALLDTVFEMAADKPHLKMLTWLQIIEISTLVHSAEKQQQLRNEALDYYQKISHPQEWVGRRLAAYDAKLDDNFDFKMAKNQQVISYLQSHKLQTVFAEMLESIGSEVWRNDLAQRMLEQLPVRADSATSDVTESGSCMRAG